MKQLQSKYTFGYLFVKLAKLLAILTVLGTMGLIAVRTVSYLNDVSRIRYEADLELEISLSRLLEEVEFATGEVSRITPVADLPSITAVKTPATLTGFGSVASVISSVETRRAELKQRTLKAFEQGVIELQSKIANTVREIERVRRATEAAPATPPVPQQPASAKPPLEPRSALDLPARTLFGQGATSSLTNSRNTLTQTAKFFEDLSGKAEKEENKQLIQGVLKEIAKLQSWLPPEPQPSRPQAPEFAAQPTAPKPQPTVPDDPLETALRTHRSLSEALSEVRKTVTGPWALDQLISAAANCMESERDQCRAAELAAHQMRTDWALKISMWTAAGLALAFVILVWADFIQSFFDTATSAELILSTLKEARRGSDQTGRGTEDPAAPVAEQ